MKPLDALLRRLESLAFLAATLCMFAIMTIVVADVFMRYVLNSPFPWAYDLVGLYLLAGVFFLALSGTYSSHSHIAVDLLVTRFSPRGRRITEALGALVGLVVMAPMAYVGWQRMRDSLAGGDVLAGALPWPTWISDALVPVGAGLLVLRLALTLAGHLASLATGRDIIALPPLTGHSSGVE